MEGDTLRTATLRSSPSILKFAAVHLNAEEEEEEVEGEEDIKQESVVSKTCDGLAPITNNINSGQFSTGGKHTVPV